MHNKNNQFGGFYYGKKKRNESIERHSLREMMSVILESALYGKLDE